MVGGIVIEVVQLPEEKAVYVDCHDTTYKQTCAIKVELNHLSLCIDIGDKIWWQGRLAFWTPQNEDTKHLLRDGGIKILHDIQIPRIGYSGNLQIKRG